MKNFWPKSSLLPILTVAVFMAGCGLKANPAPPVPLAHERVTRQALSVSAAANAARLSWRVDNVEGRSGIISIEKSVLGSHGNVCRQCPRTFETIEQVMLSGALSGEDEYTYIDSDVERGKVYSYRLKICDRSGTCFLSQDAELDYQ